MFIHVDTHKKEYNNSNKVLLSLSFIFFLSSTRITLSQCGTQCTELVSLFMADGLVAESECAVLLTQLLLYVAALLSFTVREGNCQPPVHESKPRQIRRLANRHTDTHGT